MCRALKICTLHKFKHEVTQHAFSFCTSFPPVLPRILRPPPLPAGPQISWEQLVNFHHCKAGQGIFANFAHGCDIFHDARPSTVSLSVLVTIEMFNAMNALSENQSLLVVGPLTNIWVVLACTLSVLLHLGILYIPFFADIFHAAPLNQEEWVWTIILSLPVIVLDEALKAVSRALSAAPKSKSD
jgi:Ca2+ transporting ATPase